MIKNFAVAKIRNFTQISLKKSIIRIITSKEIFMEPLSSYTISNVSAEQVRDFMELTKLAGVTISYEMMKIILQMLSNGIEPEAIYQLCVDIKNERKKQKKREKATHTTR